VERLGSSAAQEYLMSTFRNPSRRECALMRFSVLFCLCFSLCAAAEMPHADQALRPIRDTLVGLDLHRLEALPIQHGGRYKPFHAYAMEILDGINGRTTLGQGHTATTSLLDLLFCRSAYDQLPIVVVKQVELRRDLAQTLPVAERQRLLDEGLLTPARVMDPAFQRALETLGRQTAKTKALNQVHRARAGLDATQVLTGLRFLPLPAGLHSDRWRNPVEVAAPWPTVVSAFAQAGQAAGGTLESYAQLTWSLLPLSPETAQRLGLSANDLQHINMHVLWPLWKAAGAGTLDVAAISADPSAGVAASGISGDAAMAVTAGMVQLVGQWQRLQVPDTDLAHTTDRPALESALADASAAWSALGTAWVAARQTGAAIQPSVVQLHIDALDAAVTRLRALLDADHAARGTPPVHTNTTLEMTYWRWNGFSGVAWCFLLAVPFLALGAMGGYRWALTLGYGLAGLGLAGQIVAFIIRWMLAQRVPLANLYESMNAAALLCSVVALVGEITLAVKARHATTPGSRGALALGAALFGCIIVLAQVFLERHDINAFISPAMPILSEFWLRVHTSCIVSSYGIIGLGGLMSVTYLLMRIRLRHDDPRCIAWDRTTFAITALASVVLWVGLVLGAVWAAVSWGRPWGWDPKEVFALLTWVVFIILVHLRLVVSSERRGIATAWISLAAMLVMIFNWYWVNVRLAGLHSYA